MNPWRIVILLLGVACLFMGAFEIKPPDWMQMKDFTRLGLALWATSTLIQ